MDNVERIRVGFKAMEFSLSDSDGKPNRLSDFLGEKSIILAFVPGIGWQNLNSFLKKLEEISSQNQNKSYMILAVSPEHPSRALQLKKQLSLTFPILWDKNSQVAELYGVVNQDSVQKYPYPSVFTIDQQGIIRYKEVSVESSQMPILDAFFQCSKG